MNPDIIIFFANIFLTGSIIPQLIKNYRSKNVTSHCIYWHIFNLLGFAMLIYAFTILDLWIAVIGITFSIIFRAIFLWQILNYKVVEK